MPWSCSIIPGGARRAALADGTPVEYEPRLRSGSDGTYRWFLTRAVPIRDKRGNVLKWCVVATDIEDRKRAEQFQADLTHVSRVSTLGELAASISHEPIAATITNAQTSLRWLKRDQPDVEEACGTIKRIAEDGVHASEIIDRLRMLYKKAPPKREVIAVNEVIGEMVMLLRGEASRCAVSIRTDPTADVPQVMADHVQLQQVLMNLMLNGIEAMKELGGVLRVESGLEQNGEVLIAVADTGVGLPLGTCNQIFDAFFTTKPNGSGMGLAICRTIVESHGGRIWTTVNEGRGATFHFTLPTVLEESTLTVSEMQPQQWTVKVRTMRFADTPGGAPRHDWLLARVYIALPRRASVVLSVRTSEVCSSLPELHLALI